MRICAIICEFNPFHNGHKYLIEQAKSVSGCDFVLCIMSGNFNQRGEPCILDEYTRATHAIKGGADCVIKLPAHFAVAPAEIFAKGALSILSAIPELDSLAFGCETATADQLRTAAKLLVDEPEKFKKTLKLYLNSGESYIRSYQTAFKSCGGDPKLLSLPNNVLALEYVKNIIRGGLNIKYYPVRRVGGDYNGEELKENFSSAAAIRANLNDPRVKDNVPDFVLKDLLNTPLDKTECEKLFKYCLFTATREKLRGIYGCAEGLDNQLKNLQYLSYPEIVAEATGKRYTSARIKRILCANALDLSCEDANAALKNGAYIKILAVNKARANQLMPILARSSLLVTSNSLTYSTLNCVKTGEAAEKLAEADRRDFELYTFLTSNKRLNGTVRYI